MNYLKTFRQVTGDNNLKYKKERHDKLLSVQNSDLKQNVNCTFAKFLKLIADHRSRNRFYFCS